jgi:acetone carboxylase gamma subunit
MRTPITTDEWVTKAKLVHGNTYDYSKAKYTKHDISIEIICPIHGSFFQKPVVHSINGCGCPLCKSDKAQKRYSMNLSTFISRSNEKHNNKYDYSLSTYKNNRTKTRIICPDHGIFDQVPMSHIKGVGCPSCARMSSKGETMIAKILTERDIPFIRQKIFNDCKRQDSSRCLPFDFYIPSQNLLIEFDGEHHFYPVIFSNNPKDKTYFTNYHKRVKENDIIKNQYATKYGIRMLRIPYYAEISPLLPYYDTNPKNAASASENADNVG